jgi:hypothetical protein
VGLDHEVALTKLQGDKTVVSRLEAIRATVSAELDYIKGENAAEELLVRMNPLLFVEGIPRSYQAIDGTAIEGHDTDLFARSITRALFSKTHPGTGGAATVVACGIPGTIPSEMIPSGSKPSFGGAYKIRIGHPSGVMELEARLTQDDRDEIQIHSTVVGRTARVLMEGVAFIR